MSQKSDFLLKKAQDFSLKAKAYEVDLVVCGGLAIHMLSDFLKRDSLRAWNHKDIDFIVPLSQLSKAIAFFKEMGFIKVFVPHKKRRLTKNHARLANVMQGQKVLVDIYGLPRVPIIRIERDGTKIALVSPRLELENWIDRRQRLGSRPAIDLSIEFLSYVVNKGSLKEEELGQRAEGCSTANF